jgi:crotonobetaine/carnitine-CoA ligase
VSLNFDTPTATPTDGPPARRNISSYEVEQVLLRHPGISDAAVFAVPSELAEDEVMAVLVPAPDNHLDLAEMAAHCAGELPYFAVPRYLELARELPLTSTGKVQKQALRTTGVTPTTWDRLRAITL